MVAPSSTTRKVRLRRALAVVSLVMGLGASGAAFAKERVEADDVDYVELAAKMIADGHYDRAEEMLAGVDPKAEGVDAKKLFTLRGVVYLGQQLFAAAAESFEAAIVAGQTEPVVQLYLGRAQFGARRYAACLAALDAAGAAAAATQDAHLMRAQAEWELGRKARSIGALNAGLARFPASAELQRMRIFFLVDLGLYQEALAHSAPYLRRQAVTEADYLAVGEALRAGGQLAAARLLLERALLRFPGSEKLTVQLAHAYLDQGHSTAAALLFEDAARQNSRYYLESAELYKRAQRLDRALSLNARVFDQKAKLTQRLSLLLSKEQFEQVAAMAPSLSRLDLLADENVRYALAFAYFHTGQLALAEEHARRISDGKLFEASLELRKAIERCRDAGWECRP